MAQPTVESRRRRRIAVLTGDAALAAAIAAALPAGWEMGQPRSPDELGGFEDVLQLRFVVLDLDDAGEADALDVIDAIRREMMLNVPIFCCGGDAGRRDAARLARADRFFERAEIAGRVPAFCEQFGW